MEFGILIPTQETEVAQQLIDYADEIMQAGLPIAKKVAKEIAEAKYWEAYDCEDTTRQEYWRQVKIRLDTI